MKSKLYTELGKVSEHNAVADERFLLAWKRGVHKLGLEFFNIKTNVEETKDKNDLRPNYDFIKKTIAGYSRGQQALLGLMYSFFDPEEGQKLLEKIQMSNFVDALAILDLDGQKIVSELCENYTGW